MEKYLITLEPMEPYFFGGERTFGFGKEIKRKPPYYIVSEKTPSQTTLFGTLRYIILAQRNALLGQKESGKTSGLVGKESFSFEKALKYSKFDLIGRMQETAHNSLHIGEFQQRKDWIKQEHDNIKQSFGIIRRISPLFLMRDDVWYIQTPYDHKPGNQVYTPFKMDETSVKFGNGATRFPSDYKAKEGYGGGYVSLDDLSIISDKDIFLQNVKTGINSHRTEDVSAGIKNDSSFFKKECKMLAEGFSFAFIADLSERIESGVSVVFMGQDKSPFRCTITETDVEITKKVEEAFKEKHNFGMKYALSDIMPVESSFPGGVLTDYYIADTRVIRNLETDMSKIGCYEDSYYVRLKRSEKLYKLLSTGSVFYTEKDICQCRALQTIGMNILVNI